MPDLIAKIKELRLRLLLTDANSTCDQIEDYLHDDGKNINLDEFRFEDGQTIIHILCIHNPAAAQFFIEKDFFDVSIVNDEGRSLIWQALNTDPFKHVRLIKLLLGKMAKKDIPVKQEDIEFATQLKDEKSRRIKTSINALVQHNKSLVKSTKLMRYNKAPGIPAINSYTPLFSTIEAQPKRIKAEASIRAREETQDFTDLDFDFTANPIPGFSLDF